SVPGRLGSPPKRCGSTFDGLPVNSRPSTVARIRPRSRRSPSAGITNGSAPAASDRAVRYFSPTTWKGWGSISRRSAGTPMTGLLHIGPVSGREPPGTHFPGAATFFSPKDTRSARWLHWQFEPVPRPVCGWSAATVFSSFRATHETARLLAQQRLLSHPYYTEFKGNKLGVRQRRLEPGRAPRGGLPRPQ